MPPGENLTLGPGRIIWAVFPGKRGEGKIRPMIVTTRRTDILRTGKVFAVACSTEFADPPRPNEVRIPHRPDGMGTTGLRVDTVAVCNWSGEVSATDIKSTSGWVPSALLRDICNRAGITLATER